MSQSSSKPLMLYLTLFLFSLIILAISVVNQSVSQTHHNLGITSSRPTIRQQQQIEIIVPLHGNFPLPDPGILPSHPLYIIKMISNKATLMFAAVEPKRQAELLFDYANIRMSAANELIQQGEVDLAVTTATKGQIYIWQAIRHSQHIPSAQQAVWYDTLKQTLLKHEEVIEKIRFLAKNDRRDQADRLWYQLADYRQQVSNQSGIPFDYPRPEDAVITTDEPSM